jgi:uncharacterized membrane protein
MPHRLRRLPLALSLLLIAGFAIHVTSVMDALPERVASHFDGAGRPNGFQSRDGFLWISLAMSLGLFATLSVTASWVRRIPNGLLNFPNKDYWLTAERRDAAITRFAVFLDWFGFATLIVTTAAWELALQANLTRAPFDNRTMWGLLGAYLAFTIVWSIGVMRAFAIPASARTR